MTGVTGCPLLLHRGPRRPPRSAPGARDLRVAGLSPCSRLGRHARLLFGDEIQPLAASAQLSSARESESGSTLLWNPVSPPALPQEPWTEPHLHGRTAGLRAG